MFCKKFQKFAYLSTIESKLKSRSQCDFWCDFAWETAPYPTLHGCFFAKHRADWEESYHILVYTTQVNSAFRAIWLVPQSRDIKYYSPPGGFRVKKMSRETHFIRKWSNFLGIAIRLVLYILKQLFASVSLTSGGYLPRRSGSVNIHRYSPPLLRIIVNYLKTLLFPISANLTVFCRSVTLLKTRAG